MASMNKVGRRLLGVEKTAVECWELDEPNDALIVHGRPTDVSGEP